MSNDNPPSVGDAPAPPEWSPSLLADAERIVSLVSEVAVRGERMRDKAQWLIEKMAGIIDAEFDYSLMLFDDLGRTPIARLADRLVAGPASELMRARQIDEMQELLDICAPIQKQMLPIVMREMRVPTTFIYSRDLDPIFFRGTHLPRLLQPLGWCDTMACYWAGSNERAIVYNVLRRPSSRPFDNDDSIQLALMTCAVAPIFDATLFAGDAPDELAVLTEIQRPVLLAILQGMSDRQIAELLGCMTDEVEIIARDIMAVFDAKTRGQLIAMCVDQRVIHWLKRGRE
jgi:DNA-binding CsgD family transcriptional regulator